MKVLCTLILSHCGTMVQGAVVIPNIISHRPPECRIAVAPFFCLPQFSGSNSLAIWPQVTGLYAAERSSLFVIPVYNSIS